MLQITIPATEGWDSQKEEFVEIEKEQTLQLEHSLVSISKWESKYCKPFLGNQEKTTGEIIDYIKCMTITQNVKDDIYYRLTKQNIDDINNYISAPMTATTFNQMNSQGSREIVTSELIYYWMIALQIPMECQRWHINRLLTLVRICNIKNNPGKKMNNREIASNYASINAARRAKMGTRG